MDIFQSFSGMVRVELTAADPAGALRQLEKAGIPVFGAAVQDEDIVLSFSVRRRDYRRLHTLAEEKNYGLKLVRKRGVYWTVRRFLHRPVLVFTVALLLFLLLWVPSRVFFFEVEGNVTVPTRLILEKSAQCGIAFGASREAVRSERMKNALLEAIPELQWAGINTSGCTATISVKERSAEPEEEKTEGVASIVADRDGVVTQCTVTRGSAACQVGQAVTAGDILISGYTDCGISIRAERAQGEVFALTKRDLTVVTPEKYLQNGAEIRQVKRYAAIIGKNRINFYKSSGISGVGCVKMYSEKYVTLPGGFLLPVSIVTEVWTYYETEEVSADGSDAETLLSAMGGEYLLSHMVAGEILFRKETISADGGIYCLNGVYSCREMIGRLQYEEMIPNGKFG